LGSAVGLRPTLDEEGAEDLVTALKRLAGFQEEAATRIFGHGRASGSRVTFRPFTALRRQLRSSGAQRPTQLKAVNRLEKRGPRGIDQQLAEGEWVNLRTTWTGKSPCSAARKCCCFQGKQQLPSRPHQGDLGAAEIGVQLLAYLKAVRDILASVEGNSSHPAKQ
jgi:hypothetical protein